MSERLTTEHLRIEYRDDPDLLALMDEYEVLRARVAKLEAALKLTTDFLDDTQDALKVRGWGDELDVLRAALSETVEA